MCQSHSTISHPQRDRLFSVTWNYSHSVKDIFVYISVCSFFFFFWRVNWRLHFSQARGRLEPQGVVRERRLNEGLDLVGGNMSSGCTGKSGGRGAELRHSWAHPRQNQDARVRCCWEQRLVMAPYWNYPLVLRTWWEFTLPDAAWTCWIRNSGGKVWPCSP